MQKNIILLLIIISFSFTGCLTTISKIRKTPEKYHKKTVCVFGRVVSSLDLANINCFTAKGIKSHILVVTPNYLPLVRDFLLVKGTVDTAYRYEKSRFLVIREHKKKLRKPEEPTGFGEKLPKRR